METLQQIIMQIATCIDSEQEPHPADYACFMQTPELAFDIITLLQALDNDYNDAQEVMYDAYLFAFDVCLTQLKAFGEHGHNWANKSIVRLMTHITEVMYATKHTIEFWLPIFNLFYDAHIDLSDNLKNAYLELAAAEEQHAKVHAWSHLTAIQELIMELAPASDFAIVDTLFAQGAAMTPDFFADLVMDLYSIDEGHELALLMLLHPQCAVREVVVATLDMLLPKIKLSSLSLSRLRAIAAWYPETYQAKFAYWIKQQRKQGVVFASLTPATIVRVKASEIDGSGAQGLFIEVNIKRKMRICGLLLKQSLGIKDAWLTPALSAKELAKYKHEVFDEGILLRNIDIEYVQQMANHCLAISQEQQVFPSLYLLEIQEMLNITFVPIKLNLAEVIQQLTIEIIPFTQEKLTQALEYSLSWAKKNKFIDTWFIEDQYIDKLVNRYSIIEDGVKICHAEEAMEVIFREIIEPKREQWCFYFVWVTLWLKACARLNATNWHTSALIAYSIQSGTPLYDIPIMRTICQQSMMNSIATMRDRRSHIGSVDNI